MICIRNWTKVEIIAIQTRKSYFLILKTPKPVHNLSIRQRTAKKPLYNNLDLLNLISILIHAHLIITILAMITHRANVK